MFPNIASSILHLNLPPIQTDMSHREAILVHLYIGKYRQSAIKGNSGLYCLKNSLSMMSEKLFQIGSGV